MEKFNTTLATLGFLIASLGLFCDWQQNKTISELDLKYKSMDYRPILELIEKPEIVSLVPAIVFEEDLPELGFEKEGYNAIFIHDLQLKIKIINSGNCAARIAATAYIGPMKT